MRTIETTVDVQTAHDLTLNELTALIEQGHEIVYTPHIGNKWREDMALTSIGVPQVTFMRNAAYKDVLDRPHQVRVGGQDLQLAGPGQSGVLSPYLVRDGQDAEKIREILGDRATLSPGQMHYESAQEAVPGTYHLSDDFVFLRDGISARILDILDHVQRNGDLNVFDRRVEDRQIVTSRQTETDTMNGFTDLAKNLVANLRGETDKVLEGPIPSNDFAVTALALRAALQQVQSGRYEQNATVYTVSGPSMLKYAKGMRQTMSRILSLARDVEPRLPNNLTFRMVPGATLEFLPHSGEVQAVDLIERITALERDRQGALSNVSQSAGEAKFQAIAAKKDIEGRQQPLVADYRRYLAQRRFFSQYDVLDTGETVVVPAALRGITLLRLQQLLGSRD